MLLMHVLKKTRVELITQSDYPLSETELATYLDLCQRRERGEPVAYLTGHREFFGLPLKVSADVLIPRPDTELLVELGISHAPPGSNLLDLGTGSGAIAIALARQRPDLQIWATDISAAALSVAKDNALTHACQIEFAESNWFAELPDRQWQTIVSNPPYIERDDPHLEQGDLRFEPIDALTDHADGLTAYRQIIHGATTRLTQGGWLLLEHGYDQAQSVRDLLVSNGFTGVRSWTDIAGIERVSGGTNRI